MKFQLTQLNGSKENWPFDEMVMFNVNVICLKYTTLHKYTTFTLAIELNVTTHQEQLQHKGS